MERLKIGESNRDTIINAIKTCKKTTVALTKLTDKEVLNEEVENEFCYMFDGLWELIFALYPLEILEDSKRNDLYMKFQEYLENDAKSIEEFFEIVEAL